MKNFISIDNLDLKSSSSIKSFITATSEVDECLINNVLQENKNIWLSDDFLPQEIVLDFRNVKLKEIPKKLTAIGIYCWNKYPTNPKIIEVLISKEKGMNYISLGHFDLSFKAGRQLIYLDDENDAELEEILSTVDFNDLIIKLIIKETFGGKHTYINNLYLYDKIDTNNINISNNNLNNDINNEQNTINQENNENNNINNDYVAMNENENDMYENNNINDMNINENENENKVENSDLNKIENKENLDNEKMNGNENLQQDIIENAQNISNNDINEDNGIQHINYEIDNYNQNQIANINIRESKTPKIRKDYINKEDRQMIPNSLTNRNINTTVRQYNNKNNLIFENNINNDVQYNEMSSSDKLNYVLNEFKNFRENQEYMMNAYESRVRLLEDKCFELKNNLKKMNATMNTIIDSQYSQNQASNDYLIRECHNMVNEAIVNILSNMGRNFNSYNSPMYQNQNFYMNRNRNLNNNNYFNNYGNNMNIYRNNNNYIQNENYMNREMDYNGMNNYIYNEDNFENKNFLEENENGNEDNNININDNINNNHDEEYLEKEISNNKQDEEQYNNNDINKENEDNNDNIILNNNSTIKVNNNIDNKNYNNNFNKKKYVKEFYNEKAHTDISNKNIDFSSSTNSFKAAKKNIINPNKNNNYMLENDNLNNNTLTKSKSNTNIKMKIKNNNISQKNEINNSFQIMTEKRLSRKNIHPEINRLNKTYKNNENDLSSDNSSDDIKINTRITENILKPTLEKFESYMNVNNFGKSQNVYSMNSFNKKKEIFGENNTTDNKLAQSKMNKEKK